MPVTTLRSLARTLELSRTTVSDALRGSKRVQPATAARVFQAAKDTGYRRNPLAGALMSELRLSRGTAFRGMLAAIHIKELNRPNYAARYQAEVCAGAAHRAADLGFKLETLVVDGTSLTVPQLNGILEARGIFGVLLLPVWSEPDFTGLDWNRLAGVYTDHIIERPALDCICPDYYRALLAALNRLLVLGYKRPGLFLQRHQDERLKLCWRAALATFQMHFTDGPHVPPLVMEEVKEFPFTEWFYKYNPDVVVGHEIAAIDWMEACGAKIPATHGFICLTTSMKPRSCAGLDLQPRLLGRRAIEMLTAQLQRNERGIPRWQSSTTIPARWADGPTLRSSTTA